MTLQHSTHRNPDSVKNPELRSTTLTPPLSVAVPAVNVESDIRDCLAHLESQRGTVDLEVLLIDRIGVSDALLANRPWVRRYPVEKSVTIPEMRAHAFDKARGDAVAMIEDHVMVPGGWAEDMLAALAASDGVVAGSVENAATETLVDWACFLCEYSQCLPPIPGGQVEWLTGNNTVYSKELLARHHEATHAGKWENHLHDAIKAGGGKLVCRPDIVVGHKKHYTIREYTTQRYLYARSYAGARVSDMSPLRKLIYGMAAFILPPMLFLRIVRNIVSKRHHTGLLIRSLPLIALFVMSWGIGEIIGYWFGPGDSLAKVC